MAMLTYMPTTNAGPPAPEPIRIINTPLGVELLAQVDGYAHRHGLRRAPAVRQLLRAALLAEVPVELPWHPQLSPDEYAAEQAATGQLPGQTAITP